MKLMAVDGNSIFYRAFYGVRPLSNRDGFPTNAIYGFINILLKEIKEVEPDGVVIAFDLPGGNFRHEHYSEYKANRKPAPDDLVKQIPVIKEIITLMGYKTLERVNFEADDILGTLACFANEQKNELLIISGDRDNLQLVDKYTTVRLASSKQGTAFVKIYDVARVCEEYQVENPKQLIEIKALMGDSSDNIPGVTKVGQKTAIKLISEYGSIEKLYSVIDEITLSKSLKENLIKDKEMAFLSRFLGEINCSVPVPQDFAEYKIEEMDKPALLSRLTGLEMRGIINRLDLSGETQEIKEEVKIKAKKQVQLKDAKTLYGKQVSISIESGQCSIATEEIVFTTSSKAIIAEILATEEIQLITLSSKELYRYGLLGGIEVTGVSICLQIAAYLLAPHSSSYSLEAMALTYLGISDISGISECELVYKVGTTLLKEVKTKGLSELLYNIELPLSQVLASMEIEGIKIDKASLAEFGKGLDEQIKQLREEIYIEAGHEFNINSPKQMGVVLFDELELPVRKKTKTGYSTNAEVLDSLVNHHPIIGKILEYRQVVKLSSTYVKSFLIIGDDKDRIHSTFIQTQARTGRISSTNPNLQNIPIRTKLGSQLRKFFIAEEGNILVDADYSQIELRVLAHLSGDKNMISAFNSNEDIHLNTASEIFDMPPLMVTKVMRSRAKSINFGIVYGMGAFKLARDTGVSVKEAKTYIENYFTVYSGVKEFLDKTVADATKSGEAKTMFGRIRPIPELKATNKIVKAAGERIAMNSPIQGTAADIIKIAMVRVYNRLKKEGLKAKLILQIHDELIIEAPKKERDMVEIILREEMEKSAKLRVPLVVDSNTGSSWYDAK